MHILFLDWPCFGHDDVLNFFKQQHFTVTYFSHPDYNLRKSITFTQSVNKLFETQKFDFCFSYNYFPLMARACHAHNVKYISFVYDSPQVKLYSYTVTYPTNYIFLFDSNIVNYFRSEGISTFYYMPLPVDPYKIGKMLKQTYDVSKLSADVSFVGCLYNEEHNLYDRLSNMNGYTKGYLDGVLRAQSKVWGYNFMEECLSTDVLTQLQNLIHYHNNFDGTESLNYIFTNYFLCRKLTSLERMEYLTALSHEVPLKIYTPNAKLTVGNAYNMGPADYITETPYIFHNSKININLTLRSIHSGIPLRCMEILASGGFLLTNYQSDFLKHFIPDRDFVYYENLEDLLIKAKYYLSHEKERLKIASSGYQKVSEFHNYEVTFNKIFNIVFPQ